MVPKDILKKVRRIHLRTTRRVDELFAGNWHSAFKGRGIEFEEVRPYQVGDDVRAIDWNVTARTDQPYIKLFREERELSVMLLVDVSGSLHFGSNDQSKRELVVELAATLAMSAIRNNDRVGLSLFTEEVEKCFPPQNGSRHALRMIRELLYFQANHWGTNIGKAVDHLNRTSRRRTLVFVISDFLGNVNASVESKLKVASKRHDFVPVVVEDPRESEMPNVGLIRLRDAETGQEVTVDTSSRRNREAYARKVEERKREREELFRRLRFAPISICTGSDFVDPLRKYFRRRGAMS